MGLIGSDDNLIGQILEIFRSEKKNRKKKDSVRQIDEQGYNKSAGKRTVC